MPTLPEDALSSGKASSLHRGHLRRFTRLALSPGPIFAICPYVIEINRFRVTIIRFRIMKLSASH